MSDLTGCWMALILAGLASGCASQSNADMPRSYQRPAATSQPSSYPELPPPGTYGNRRDEAREPPPRAYPRAPDWRAQPNGYAPPPYRPDLVPGADNRQDAPPPTSAPPSTYAPPPVRYADWTEQDYRYRIGPGDQLSLRFLLNPDLNGPATVGPDGRGVFPLVSSVKVADLTAEEANGVLTQAYAQVLRRPQVEVLISAYGAAQIYVGGEVRNPGVIPIKGQLTTAQAVMSAGGMLPTARTGRVVILRQRPDGELLMKDVDLKAYLNRGQALTNFAILPGDLIFVPRSKIAEVDLFVEQYITGLLPIPRALGYNVDGARRF